MAGSLIEVVDQLVADLGLAGVNATRDPGVVRALVGKAGYCVLVEPPQTTQMMHDGRSFGVDLDVRVVVKPPGGFDEWAPAYGIIGAVHRVTGAVETYRELYQSNEITMPSMMFTAHRTYTEE